MKVTVKTVGGFDLVYNNILHIEYASPRYIDMTKDLEHHYNHVRVWSDDATGLYKEIIMEKEDNYSKKDK